MSKSIPLRAHEAAAYAAGRLTQIRRVVKPQPFLAPYRGGMDMLQLQHKKFMMIRGQAVSHYVTNSADDMTEVLRGFPCPYGAPGGALALREGFALVPISAYRCSEDVVQTANPDAETYEAAIYRAGFDRSHGGIVWRSSTSMPLWAVRWHPAITAVRLERVQEMTEADARVCGFDGNCPVGYIPSYQAGPCVYHYAVQFDRDNPRTPWESNPWVWVIDVEGAKV